MHAPSLEVQVREVLAKGWAVDRRPLEHDAALVVLGVACTGGVMGGGGTVGEWASACMQQQQRQAMRINPTYPPTPFHPSHTQRDGDDASVL